MPNTNAGLLALRRKRLGYEQKQIAVLLGHKSIHQISRYETGQRKPSLKDEVKLFILYGLPVQILFNQYFHKCRIELENAIKHSKSVGKIKLENMTTVDYCSYLELMSSTYISDHDTDKIRRHIKILMDERSKTIKE
jgi:transcriptional regulator with XRE-family HTH domain